MIGSVFMLIPFCVFVLWVSWPAIRNSWAIREVSPDPGGLPRYPLKTVIIVCFVLLLAQGIAELLKELRFLWRGNKDDAAGEDAGAEGGDAPVRPEGL